jgi:hypothetical protein
MKELPELVEAAQSGDGEAPEAEKSKLEANLGHVSETSPSVRCDKSLNRTSCHLA